MKDNRTENNNLNSMPKDACFSYDTFANKKVLFGKQKGYLPAMGWNSWNAFGSGNTEELTKLMADRIVQLGLDKIGYKYIVLDDGCYKPERVDGLLSNESVKFPSGFKALADYIHDKGLKFGMYNDIGTNLCAGAAVGTCGHERVDAQTYLDWDVDFLKVDNCYYIWDNATFSDPKNAKYVFAPNIRSVKLCKPNGEPFIFMTAKEGAIVGDRAQVVDTYVTCIGTWDGTGPEHTPVGLQSSELVFDINIIEAGEYLLVIEYATGEVEGVGSFLQIGIDFEEECELVFDDFLPITSDATSFVESSPISLQLQSGSHKLRIMNHRRQENTLGSYGTLVKELKSINPEKDIYLSICEWGKTNPHDWGYKVGDSWRILNDITFQVGSDGDPGVGAWSSDYTTSVVSQYNKAVIMDEYSGLDKGWNDPDMMMIGMNGLTETMCKTHMTMWCMMNAPLMLGMDLSRIEVGDGLWKIVANQKMVNINQDLLGIQAKRIYSTSQVGAPDMEYIRDINRVDVLAKPLFDGGVAIAFINISNTNSYDQIYVSRELIVDYLEKKMVDTERFKQARAYRIENLWSEDDEAVCVIDDNSACKFFSSKLSPCDSMVIKITPIG